MTVLKGYPTLEEAHLARSLLASEGVEADVLDENLSMAPHLLLASGFRLAVADEHAASAREILGLPEGPTAVPREPIHPMWMVGIMATAIWTVFHFGLQQRGQTADQTSDSVDSDRNRDGKPDLRWRYDRGGMPLEGLEDENFDGRWDIREKFVDGTIVGLEQDRDFDGAFDSVFEFRNGVVASETVRPGGHGHPLFRYDYRSGVHFVTWSDKNRDGKWDERIDYDSMGSETLRKPLE